MFTKRFSFFTLLLVLFVGTSVRAQMAPKSAEVTFAKDKLIEVALLSVQEGKQQQFMGDYFSKVMPVALPYGARPIASFGVTRKVEGQKPVQMVVFFEWNSLEDKRAFEMNPEYLKLRNIRDDAL
ncbi:MAG: DUF1330 domain-containing protein, partial [Bacteroidota bacterium]